MALRVTLSRRVAAISRPNVTRNLAACSGPYFHQVKHDISSRDHGPNVQTESASCSPPSCCGLSTLDIQHSSSVTTTIGPTRDCQYHRQYGVAPINAAAPSAIVRIKPVIPVGTFIALGEGRPDLRLRAQVKQMAVEARLIDDPRSAIHPVTLINL
jgi:hypothetical protein